MLSRRLQSDCPSTRLGFDFQGVVLVSWVVAGTVQEDTGASPIVALAHGQIGKTIAYDASYVGLEHPGAGVPIEQGTCTSRVVGSLRNALDMDLQKLVYEEMKVTFPKSPKM